MKSFALGSDVQQHLPRQSNSLLQSPKAKSPILLLPMISPICFTNPTPLVHHPLQHPKQGSSSSSYSNSIKTHVTRTTSHYLKKKPQEQDLLLVQLGFSRWVVLGAASLGIALFLVGIDAPNALAFGPEGPLVEEFWDNMRRYGLYILTVSTGVIYSISQPILELLKNPISAILICIILGGSIYLVSQVLSAMVGISEFAYDYG